MSEAEDLIQKGLEALSQQNYYDAMSNFTKAYNITGNIRQLIMSSDASFKLALTYLKNNDLNNWDTFSKNALDHFKICLLYSNSDEIKRIISEQINKIEEYRKKIDEIKSQ